MKDTASVKETTEDFAFYEQAEATLRICRAVLSNTMWFAGSILLAAALSYTAQVSANPSFQPEPVAGWWAFGFSIVMFLLLLASSVGVVALQVFLPVSRWVDKKWKLAEPQRSIPDVARVVLLLTVIMFSVGYPYIIIMSKVVGQLSLFVP